MAVVVPLLPDSLKNLIHPPSMEKPAGSYDAAKVVPTVPVEEEKK